MFFRKRFLMGLYTGGLYTGRGLIHRGGAYTWTIFCVSVIVINKYSNSDKQVLNKHTVLIIVINSNNSDKK
jgi:hypothetical protein